MGHGRYLGADVGRQMSRGSLMDGEDLIHYKLHH